MGYGQRIQDYIGQYGGYQSKYRGAISQRAYREIGDRVFINRNCMVVSMDRIAIGSGTSIGPGVMIYDHDHAFGSDQADVCGKYICQPIIIGDDVWIGANAIILKGVTIGNKCVIGAGSVVTKSLEPSCLYAGNPARLIRRF